MASACTGTESAPTSTSTAAAVTVGGGRDLGKLFEVGLSTLRDCVIFCTPTCDGINFRRSFTLRPYSLDHLQIIPSILCLSLLSLKLFLFVPKLSNLNLNSHFLITSVIF